MCSSKNFTSIVSLVEKFTTALNKVYHSSNKAQFYDGKCTGTLCAMKLHEKDRCECSDVQN